MEASMKTAVFCVAAPSIQHYNPEDSHLQIQATKNLMSQYSLKIRNIM
jgi:hypothetical protein